MSFGNIVNVIHVRTVRSVRSIFNVQRRHANLINGSVAGDLSACGGKKRLSLHS